MANERLGNAAGAIAQGLGSFANIAWDREKRKADDLHAKSMAELKHGYRKEEIGLSDSLARERLDIEFEQGKEIAGVKATTEAMDADRDLISDFTTDVSNILKGGMASASDVFTIFSSGVEAAQTPEGKLNLARSAYKVLKQLPESDRYTTQLEQTIQAIETALGRNHSTFQSSLPDKEEPPPGDTRSFADDALNATIGFGGKWMGETSRIIGTGRDLFGRVFGSSESAPAASSRDVLDESDLQITRNPNPLGNRRGPSKPGPDPLTTLKDVTTQFINRPYQQRTR